jgi:hypothetical protein
MGALDAFVRMKLVQSPFWHKWCRLWHPFGTAVVCMGHWWMGKAKIQICASATRKSTILITCRWHACSVSQWPVSCVGCPWISVGNLWCCWIRAAASCKYLFMSLCSGRTRKGNCDTVQLSRKCTDHGKRVIWSTGSGINSLWMIPRENF